MNKNVFITDYLAEKIQYFKTHKTADAIYYEKACIGYLVEGSAEYICDGKKYYVSKGDLIYIPKKSKCISIWKGNPDIVFYSINFDYIYTNDVSVMDFQILKGIEDRYFQDMVCLIKDHYMKSLGLFYVLLDAIMPMLKVNPVKRSSTVQRAVNYLHEHHTVKINTVELAGLCNLSVSSFYGHFKEEMGCTPVEYKNNLVVQKAAELLLYQGLTVAETAEQLGFSSSAYFSKLFKKITGKLPSELSK